jgi:hypothetical protein
MMVFFTVVNTVHITVGFQFLLCFQIAFHNPACYLTHGNDLIVYGAQVGVPAPHLLLPHHQALQVVAQHSLSLDQPSRVRERSLGA